MPRVYTTRLGVREYELDTFGELRASVYARLLQQAATVASAEAGYPDAWYAGEGTIWVIRRSTIDYIDPARAGDVLEISTWVADFRRVRSRREYEIRSQGKRVASAHTDWVYLDRMRGKLTRVTESMIEAFTAGEPAPSLPRMPLDVPAVPGTAFTSSRRVELRDLDALEHVNNATYLDYVEEAALAALDAVGWSFERLRAAGGYFRTGGHDIEYLQEARYGDPLTCILWTTSVDAATVERCTEIRGDRDGAILTHARSRWLWISRATGRPAEMPADLQAALFQ